VRDPSPHLPGMAKNDQAAKATVDTREAKLAQALRANLRRRKAATPPPPAEKPHETSTD
jgi:hypothetical protein